MVEKYIQLNTIDKVETFVNKIMIIDSDVDLISGRYVVNAKSIMAIFSVALTDKLKIVLHSDNEDEIKKFDEIVEEYK